MRVPARMPRSTSRPTSGSCEPARQHTCPRDQRSRPQAPDVRLEGQVGQPAETAPDQTPSRAAQHHQQFVEYIRHVMRLQQRAEQSADHRDASERARSVQIAFAGTQVAPDHDGRAGEAHHDNHPQDALTQPGSTGGEDAAIAILAAHRLDVERDRDLRERGTRHAHRRRIRLMADPCHHLVMRHERPLVGLSGRERLEIQVGFPKHVRPGGFEDALFVNPSRCGRNRAVVPMDRA